MPLTPGTRVGVYEILALIGRGGMGEVYRARDARLKRDVALKILPSSVANDPDRLARFRREAELLASLNHPNVASIFGLEEGAGSTALALELVEGQTLEERIARRPVPPDEAVLIGRQIASALLAAHERGIVHRDLKPANVTLRRDGTIKVLDFGLAKALDAEADAVSAAAPTATAVAGITAAGSVLGTPAYMSPEQASGRGVDFRTDVWAFGCVLFEMLTGRRAFDAASVPETLAAVIAGTPDWSRLPTAVSPPLRVLLRRCLAREVRERIGEMATVALLLDEQRALSPHPDTARGDRTATSRTRRLASLALAALLAAAVTAGALRVLNLSDTALQPVIRTTVPAALSTISSDRNFAFLTGTNRLAYVRDDGAELLVRAMDSLAAVPVVTSPAFLRGVFSSPDGRWLGYVENNFTFRRISAAGGVPVTILTADGPTRGASWGPSDAIVFATASPVTGLQEVAASGGEVKVLTRPDATRGEADHVFPAWLPDGRGVLFTVLAATGGLDAARVALMDRASGRYRILIEGGRSATYVDSGHLVYAAAGALWATRFDLSRLEIEGSPVEVVPRSALPHELLQFDVSADGILVYPGEGRNLSSDRYAPTWVDRHGREAPIPAMKADHYYHPRLSPDERRLAISLDGELYVWDLSRPDSPGARMTIAAGNDWFPVWTPDGQRIVFGSWRAGGFSNLYVQAPDSGTADRVSDSPDMQLPTAVSADGRMVVFHSFPKDVEMLSLQSGGKPTTLVGSALEERNATISPDGRWLAYEAESDVRPGQLNVFVRPFPDVDRAVWQVTSDGGTFPLWARKGDELFYIKPDGTVSATAVDAAARVWRAGRATDLFRGPYLVRDGSLGRQYDVASDGRFLMLKAQRTGERAHFVIVQNWRGELARLVP